MDVGVARRSATTATPRHFAPNDFFLPRRNVRRSVHDRPGSFHEFEQDGCEISAAAFATISPTTVLPVKR